MTNKVIIIRGSGTDKVDARHADQIADFLAAATSDIEIDTPHYARSADKLTEYLLELLKENEPKPDKYPEDMIVYITIAGMRDALSGVVSTHTSWPSIASRPDWNDENALRLYLASTLGVPKDTPYGCVLGPKATADYVKRLFSLPGHPQFLEEDDIQFRFLHEDKYDPQVEQKIREKLRGTKLPEPLLPLEPEDKYEETILFYTGRPASDGGRPKLSGVVQTDAPIIFSQPISTLDDVDEYRRFFREMPVAFVPRADNAVLFGLKLKGMHLYPIFCDITAYRNGLTESLKTADLDLRRPNRPH